MKWDTIMKYQDIIEDMDILNTQEDSIISLIGGEPTLHPKFKDILNHIKYFNHYLHVYTNGTTKFFDNCDYDLMSNFTWTFSYHGVETDDVFYDNITKLSNNGIKVELTIPAQNVNRKLIDLANVLNVETVVTFVHETSSQDNKAEIEDWVYSLTGDNIKNMAKYYKDRVSYTNYSCDYNEVDIVNRHMSSNDCNHNIKAPLNADTLKKIYKLNRTVCTREFCKQDCAFLLPRKYKDE